MTTGFNFLLVPGSNAGCDLPVKLVSLLYSCFCVSLLHHPITGFCFVLVPCLFQALLYASSSLSSSPFHSYLHLTFLFCLVVIHPAPLFLLYHADASALGFSLAPSLPPSLRLLSPVIPGSVQLAGLALKLSQHRLVAGRNPALIGNYQPRGPMQHTHTEAATVHSQIYKHTCCINTQLTGLLERPHTVSLHRSVCFHASVLRDEDLYHLPLPSFVK